MILAPRTHLCSVWESFNTLRRTQSGAWTLQETLQRKLYRILLQNKRTLVNSEHLYRLPNSGHTSSTAWPNQPSLKKTRCYNICFLSWLLQKKLLWPKATIKSKGTLPKIQFQPEKVCWTLEVFTTTLNKFGRLLVGKARKSDFRESDSDDLAYISAVLENGL